MDPFTFSTAPSVAHHQVSGGGGGAGSYSPYSYDPSGPMNSGIPTSLFSTSATPPHHDARAFADIRGALRVSSTMEASGGLNATALNSINQTLSVLQGIANSQNLSQWKQVLDGNYRPQVVTMKLNEMLVNTPSEARESAIRALSSCIKQPKHVQFISTLDDAFKNNVRDLVLQELLDQLTESGDQLMPLCAEMLVEMAKCNLVRMSGVAATIEQFLCEPGKRRAGFAVLGRAAEVFCGNKQFLRAIENEENIEKLLVELFKDPEYEYDVVSIMRILSYPDGYAKKGTSELRRACILQQPAPVTSMQYFRVRDELVTAHANGTVVIWGGPTADKSGLVLVKTVDMPLNALPVALAGSQQGQFVVAACMICPGIHHYMLHVQARRYNRKNTIFHGLPTPLLQVLFCNESTGEWTEGDILPRPRDCVLTAVAALSSGIICSAESVPATERAGPGAPLSHNITIINAATGATLHTIENAHDDYITVLTTCDDNEQVLLSGSRDKTVKLWDTRVATTAAASEATAPAAGLLYTLDTTHTDTISCIYSFRNFVFTGSLDGSLHIWDTRHISSLVATRNFTSPVLGVTALEGGCIAVATARGLFLVSLENMRTCDVVPNKAYTRILSNDNGTVLFAAGEEGISVLVPVHGTGTAEPPMHTYLQDRQ